MKQHIASLKDIWIFASVLADILEFVYAYAKTLSYVWLFSSYYVETLYGFCSIIFCLWGKILLFLVSKNCHREWMCRKCFSFFTKIEIWVKMKLRYRIARMNFNNDTFSMEGFTSFIETGRRGEGECLKKREKNLFEILHNEILSIFSRISVGKFSYWNLILFEMWRTKTLVGKCEVISKDITDKHRGENRNWSCWMKLNSGEIRLKKTDENLFDLYLNSINSTET